MASLGQCHTYVWLLGLFTIVFLLLRFVFVTLVEYLYFPPCNFFPCHIVFAQMTETEWAADACHSYCQEMGISYSRFNIPLEKKVEMVTQDVENVVELLLWARQYMQDSPQLREFAFRF